MTDVDPDRATYALMGFAILLFIAAVVTLISMLF
jgi:hypothetical protein